jgi:hypothetical protein
MLRGLSSETMASVTAYAREYGCSRGEAAILMIEIALTHRAARRLGAATANAARTPAEASAAGRKGAEARWGTRTDQDG